MRTEISDVLPTSRSCACLAIRFRSLPLPSSVSPDTHAPINVDLPASTDPTITIQTSSSLHVKDSVVTGTCTGSGTSASAVISVSTILFLSALFDVIVVSSLDLDSIISFLSLINLKR